ncbi:MAG: efflux RND transporter permease subunit [Planctomycetota bacterium]
MSLSALAMRRRPIVYTFVCLLTAWGIYTFFTMSRREDPEFTVRTCVVMTNWEGAPTTKVEELITDKLEEELDAIDEVDYLNSETTLGQSVIYVNLDDTVPTGDIQQVWDKVRAKVNLVRMPASDVKPIVNDEFGDTTVLLLGIYQTPPTGESRVEELEGYSPRQLEIFADRVQDELRLLPGIAKVEKYGVQDEAIYIETDLGNWSQIDLTTSDLQELIASRNIVLAGGSIDTAEGKFNIKPGGEFDAIREINSVSVGVVQTGEITNQVRLEDVGLSVKRDFVDPPEVICRFTEPRGTFPAVMLGLTMKSGSNIIEICDASMKCVTDMVDVQQSLPRDLEIRPVSKLSDNVNAKIDDVIENVISAILIVIVVVYLFVGLRTSLVMAANIPLVVIGAIAIISQFGVELEQISLASIIIALGLLVDNAVQVCTQTQVNLGKGMPPKDAAVQGAKTLLLPMLTGTLTTVAAFLPMLIALTGGAAEYVYSLPVTLSTTLLLSWLYAMTICVVLAAGLIRVKQNSTRPSAPLPLLNHGLERLFARVSRKKRADLDGGAETVSDGNLFLSFYGATAKVALKFKWLTVLVSVGLLFAVLQLPVGSEYFPLDKRDQFYVHVTLPETATVEQTNQIVTDVEDAITRLSAAKDVEGNAIERLRSMRSMTAGAGSRWSLSVDPLSPASNTAEILVRTTSGEWTDSMIRDLRRVVDNGSPARGIAPIVGARVTTKRVQMGPPANPVELRVSGSGFADIDTLRRIAREIKDMLRQQPGTWDISDSWGVDSFQLDVEVYDEKANLSGVSNASVADTLSAYYSGVKLTDFREGDHVVPVYFRLRQQDRVDLQGMDNAFVEGANGKLPLNSVAKIVPTWKPGKIDRRNQNRTIEVFAEVEDGYSGNDIVLSVWNSERMASLKQSLPAGYRIEIGGSLEESQDAASQMSLSFGISFLCIVLILVVQYNGWSKTLVILTTLPLAVIGAWFGLWLTNNPLGFMPQLGMLSLFGIVLNTGIIFIEFADILIENRRDQLADDGVLDGPIVGLSRQEFRDCLIAAGKQRMLPIFLTTATTVGGLVPLAMSGGPLWEGMAWLMISGLLVATLLTLYIVPALYAIIVETFGVKPVAERHLDTAT